MMTVRQATSAGKPRPRGFDSNHTFSFNQYYDPRHTGFRDLLVINEDYVAPGKGFGTHGHQNMEIISICGPKASWHTRQYGRELDHLP